MLISHRICFIGRAHRCETSGDAVSTALTTKSRKPVPHRDWASPLASRSYASIRPGCPVSQIVRMALSQVCGLALRLVNDIHANLHYHCLPI